MPCYEDDRRMIPLRDLPLQIEAVDVRQLDIEDEAGGDVRFFRADIVAGRSERHGAHAVRRQEFAERLPDALIVIDDEDDMVVRRHAAAFASTGKVKMNFAPCGSFFSAHSRPPCDSTIERQIASPMPIPCSFVVKNGSNILSGNSTPAPAVADLGLDHIPDPAHAQAENPGVRSGVHRFDAVAHQIDQHLLNLDTIERDERKIAFDVRIDADTTPRRLLGHEIQRFGYDAAERRRAPRLRGLLEQGADAADDIGGGVCVADDALGRDLRALEIRRFGREPTVAGMGIRDDGRQRLVHLVRDRSRELGEARRLARPRKALLRQTQLFLRRTSPSMSRQMTFHCTIAPSALRIGAARVSTQRYSPSKRRSDACGHMARRWRSEWAYFSLTPATSSG